MPVLFSVVGDDETCEVALQPSIDVRILQHLDGILVLHSKEEKVAGICMDG